MDKTPDPVSVPMTRRLPIVVILIAALLALLLAVALVGMRTIVGYSLAESADKVGIEANGGAGSIREDWGLPHDVRIVNAESHGWRESTRYLGLEVVPTRVDDVVSSMLRKIQWGRTNAMWSLDDTSEADSSFDEGAPDWWLANLPEPVHRVRVKRPEDGYVFCRIIYSTSNGRAYVQRRED